ncbi:ATP-binding cassette domain-containing protein [Streptomyces sp. XM4193]|uniref:ATP-binding cassette domain-containing protein n=1 Tax=Streptomyces sp. XM4193 TaxID=2929782 RepID=UPI001FF8B139|nr:ATP-binding cassette domain-containing protein [Streptomyces sp. XM4193]MCK1796348.1 ATP-binding cassette domain-containing protein [Streptomyces sp. XM4193]
MRGASVTAEGLGMDGPRGTVFRGVELSAEAGELVAVQGPSGSGRTCLLLALTGRMRTTAGRAEVDGLPLPKRMAAVREITALGPVPDVNDPDPALTVAEHLRERSLLRPYFRGWRRERSTARRERVERAMELAGLSFEELPKGPRTTVRQLERRQELRLGVALALLDEPRLIAVDDVGLKLSDAERLEMWGLLRTVAAAGVTVLASCAQAPEDTAVLRIDAADDPAPGYDGSPEPGAEEQPEPGAEERADPAAAEEAGTSEEPSRRDTTGSPAEATSSTTTTTATTTAKEGSGDAFAETGRA